MTPLNTDLTENPADLVTQIASAARLIGLEFTADECVMMAEGVVNSQSQLADLRAISLANNVAPALAFHPAPLGAPAIVASATEVAAEPMEFMRPQSLEDLAFLPVTQLAHLLRTRQVSSLELTELYLARLKQFDPQLQCVVTLTEDLALTQAQRADAEIAAGQYRGPLHGIPWGAKDLLAVRDYPTTWGAETSREQRFDEDATVVERLSAAGAVLVAKLTTGALALGDVWFGGQTKNPWDLNEGSSGSSAGPAAAVAAGLVGFAIGTETMGSIISPCARCGVTGLRPTFGRVSRHGCMALTWSMDKIGPMTRSVEDCALVLEAIYGPDGRDATVAAQPFTWPVQLDWHKLRVGYVASAFAEDAPGHADHMQTMMTLRDLGAQLTPISLPEYPHQAIRMILVAEAAAAFDELTRSNRDDLLKRQDTSAWPNTFRLARLIPAVEYIQANRIRTQLMHAMQQVMSQVDLYLQPCNWGADLALTNYTGHPAVVLPNGFSATGKPANSMVFIGQLYGEAVLLAAAQAYQNATDFHQRQPRL